VLVLLILAAILMGILIGLLSGGSIRLLSEIQLRWWPLAIVGLLLQVVPLGRGSEGTSWLPVALVAASYALLFVFLIANFRVAGVPMIAVGIGLNAVVIGLNGGMPVSDAALRSAAAGPVEYEAARAKLDEQGPPKHHLASDEDVLSWLGDAVGLGPPIEQVYSVGDFLALGGILWLFVAATRGPPGRHAPGRHESRRRRPVRPPDPS
jgi:hypothetical protein